MTKQSFKGLYSRYGFTQAERGALDAVDECLKTQTTKVTVQAMLQADHENRHGLNGKHAKKAIEMTPEIPAGIY